MAETDPDPAAALAAIEVKFLQACASGNPSIVEGMLEDRSFDVNTIDSEGRSGLILAAGNGHFAVINVLLSNGAIWNLCDFHGQQAGDYALEGSFDDIYSEIVNAGVRAELLFAALGETGREDTDANSGDMHDDDDDEADADRERPAKRARNEQRQIGYLEGRAVYTADSKLLSDENSGAVMMEWEEPLMKMHADILCSRSAAGRNATVLNVGFGLGLIDGAIQALKPAHHVIIEAHPDVLRRMKEAGWMDMPNVTVLAGKWQDVMGYNETTGTSGCPFMFDAIFFDTYAEYYEDMREFHTMMTAYLNPGGVYTFFNGLGATSQVAHDVASRLVEVELNEVGFTVEWTSVPINVNPSVWEGVKQVYWKLSSYKLPVCLYPLQLA
jgi:type IV protein arginine methyltransferase